MLDLNEIWPECIFYWKYETFQVTESIWTSLLINLTNYQNYLPVENNTIKFLKGCKSFNKKVSYISMNAIFKRN